MDFFRQMLMVFHEDLNSYYFINFVNHQKARGPVGCHPAVFRCFIYRTHLELLGVTKSLII